MAQRVTGVDEPSWPDLREPAWPRKGGWWAWGLAAAVVLAGCLAFGVHSLVERSPTRCAGIEIDLADGAHDAAPSPQAAVDQFARTLQGRELPRSGWSIGNGNTLHSGRWEVTVSLLGDGTYIVTEATNCGTLHS